MAFDLDLLVRDNIRSLTPYSSARSEFQGCSENIFLDANENSFGSPIAKSLNRYPDAFHTKVKEKIAEFYDLKPAKVFLGNGSDEVIDLVFRIFCEPRSDEVIVCPPTYGMFEVSAAINGIEVKRCDLTPNFGLNLPGIQEACSDRTKIIFLCSPNNPTGNLLDVDDILTIVRSFRGVVVIDEAYIHFANRPSLIRRLDEFPNLVVIQTFSKAWGLAGLRVGVAFANDGIIELFDRVKPPYNVGQLAQEFILEAIGNFESVKRTILTIIDERENLARALRVLRFVVKVYPSDANFILVKVSRPQELYDFLLTESIVVRDRSNVAHCEGCLRITVGNTEDNRKLLDALRRYEKTLIC